MNSSYENNEPDNFSHNFTILEQLTNLKTREKLLHSYKESQVTLNDGTISRIIDWACYENHYLVARGLFRNTESDEAFSTSIEAYNGNNSDKLFDVTSFKRQNVIGLTQTDCSEIWLKFLNKDYFCTIPKFEEDKKFVVYRFPGKKLYTFKNIPDLPLDPSWITLLQNKYLIIMRANMERSLIEIRNLETGKMLKFIPLNLRYPMFLSALSHKKNTMVIGFDENTEKNIFEIHNIYSGKIIPKRFYLDLTPDYILHYLLVSKHETQIAILLEECKTDLHRILFFDTRNFFNQTHKKPIGCVSQNKEEYYCDFRNAFGFFANSFFKSNQITKEKISSIENKNSGEKNNEFKL